MVPISKANNSGRGLLLKNNASNYRDESLPDDFKGLISLTDGLPAMKIQTTYYELLRLLGRKSSVKP